MEKLILNKKTIENRNIEFKSASFNMPQSFYETYSSFSNTNGGYIYLGIKEKNGIISSSKLSIDNINNLKKEMFNNLNNKQKVSINLIDEDEVKIKEYENYYVLEIKVNEAKREYKPVYINNNILLGTYKRNNEGDYKCDKDEITRMLRDSAPKDFNLTILKDFSINDLNKDTIESYKNRLKSYSPNHIFLKGDNLFLLERIGAIIKDKDNNYYPTIAGLLMFGDEYKINYEFIYYFLDYQEHLSSDIRWDDRFYSSMGSRSGNIFDFYLNISNKLTYNLKKPFALSNNIRNDDTILDEAIREALVNTLSNADYYLNHPVLITKYNDRIVFKNPGDLRIDIKDAIKGGKSDPRNRTILKMFNLIGLGERSGSGIPTIFETMRVLNFKDPELIEDKINNETTLIIYLTSKNELINDLDKYNLSNKEKSILDYINKNKEVKAIEISKALNINISTTKYILYKLIDKNLIISKGNIKTKRYLIK